MAGREEFTRLTGPYRRELIAHCLLAQDLVPA
jgi:hypothetical protein